MLDQRLIEQLLLEQSDLEVSDLEAELTLNAEGLVIDCKVHAESLDASPGVVPPDLSQLELILNSKGLVIDFKGDYTKLISSDKGKNVLKKTDLHVACKNVVVQYQASKASSALIFLALFVAFSLVLFGACLGRHPEGARKKITEHAPFAEFMPKHGRLASACLEKSEEFFISLSDWDRYYTLSCSIQATIEIDRLMDGIDYSCSLSRARVEDINMDFLRNSMGPVVECVQPVVADGAAVQPAAAEAAVGQPAAAGVAAVQHVAVRVVAAVQPVAADAAAVQHVAAEVAAGQPVAPEDSVMKDSVSPYVEVEIKVKDGKCLPELVDGWKALALQWSGVAVGLRLCVHLGPVTSALMGLAAVPAWRSSSMRPSAMLCRPGLS